MTGIWTFSKILGEYISLSSDRTAEVMGMIIKQRFHGSKSLFDLTPQEQTTAFDELNAVVWGSHKADQENAREQFADMFQDYDAYIADLDAAMESGAEPEVPGLPSPLWTTRTSATAWTRTPRRSRRTIPRLSGIRAGGADPHPTRLWGTSDEQYNRLERSWWKNPYPVDWRETLAPEGFDSTMIHRCPGGRGGETDAETGAGVEFEGSLTLLKDLGQPDCQQRGACMDTPNS